MDPRRRRLILERAASGDAARSTYYRKPDHIKTYINLKVQGECEPEEYTPYSYTESTAGLSHLKLPTYRKQLEITIIMATRMATKR